MSALRGPVQGWRCRGHAVTEMENLVAHSERGPRVARGRSRLGAMVASGFHRISLLFGGGEVKYFDYERDTGTFKWVHGYVNLGNGFEYVAGTSTEVHGYVNSDNGYERVTGTITWVDGFVNLGCGLE